jgi:hypothetical protein
VHLWKLYKNKVEEKLHKTKLRIHMHVKMKVGVINWRKKCKLLDINLKKFTKKASIRPDFVWPLKITIIHRSAL